MELDDVYGAKVLGVKAIGAMQDDEGNWIPRVEVSYKKRGRKRSLVLQWKEQTRETKKEAEDYAATYGKMAIKQRLKGIK